MHIPAPLRIPASLLLITLAAACGQAPADHDNAAGPLGVPPPSAATPAPSVPPPPACAPPPQGPYDRDFSLAVWLANHATPDAVTTQRGEADPAPFAGTDFPAEISAFRAAWQQMIGPLPQSCVPLDPREEPLGLTPQEQAGIDREAYTMSRVSYRGAHGERIPAYLLVPRGLSTPRPAVLVMHQSLAVCGKKEPAGVCLQAAPRLALARDLARAGFITLAPDSIGYGERAHSFFDAGSEYPDAAPLLARFPGATLMGLRISDVRRGLDFLASLPRVDGRRLGMIGHSNGGVETLFTAAFDERIRCAVVNAGPNLVRREVLASPGLRPGVSRWAGEAYMPAFGYFNDDIAALPVETHQLYGMIAPRGLFVSQMEDDSIAPIFDRIDFAMTQAQRAYDALGGDFSYHTIQSGLTPACRDEWAAPSCLSFGYQDCLARQEGDCLARYAAAGITAACVASDGTGLDCAHRLFWSGCRAAGQDEAQCLAAFQQAGLDTTPACLDRGFTQGCRRDHGWYPETRDLAYPWLAACLAAP